MSEFYFSDDHLVKIDQIRSQKHRNDIPADGQRAMFEMESAEWLVEHYSSMVETSKSEIFCDHSSHNNSDNPVGNCNLHNQRLKSHQETLEKLEAVIAKRRKKTASRLRTANVMKYVAITATVVSIAFGTIDEFAQRHKIWWFKPNTQDHSTHQIVCEIDPRCDP